MKTRRIGIIAAAVVAFAFIAGFAAKFGSISSDGQNRLLNTNGTRSATWVTPGRIAATQAAAIYGFSDPMAYRVSLGKLKGEGRRRGVEVTFFGVGADNATINYRAWRVKHGFNPYSAYFSSQPSEYDFDLICTGVATLGNVGVGNDELDSLDAYFAIPVDNKIADTVTCVLATTGTTPKGISGILSAQYGAPDPAAFSPANNTPGKLIIPDMGGGDLYLEIYVDTATSCNALVEPFE